MAEQSVGRVRKLDRRRHGGHRVEVGSEPGDRRDATANHKLSGLGLTFSALAAAAC